MFFKRSKYENLVEAPLGYWEEESYFLVILNKEESILSKIIDRVSKIKEVKILKNEFITDNGTLMLKIKYRGKDYEVGFYLTTYTIPKYYLNKSISFSHKDIEQLNASSMALTIFMKFNDNIKESYHLQLKLAVNIVPDALAIMDESAEKLISFKWATMAANSKVLPSASDLFTVQAINHKSGEVWLHTHGLCRCHLTELEILNSNQKNYISHYNLINNFGMYLIDKIDYPGYAPLGVLKNRELILATYVSWTIGLKEYSKVNLGNLDDRKNSHNSHTSIIFLYKTETDAKNKKLSKVDIYNDMLQDNPIFFISDEETNRMHELALERFDYVKEAFKDKENEINLKIGLLVDNKDNYEHIWFKLVDIKDDKVKAILLQEPYDVKNLHEGDIAWYNKENITDWIIYTNKYSITPSNVYLMEVDKK